MCLILIKVHIFNVGAYAEWLGNALPQLIPRLVASLQAPETATSATMALKDITRERTTSLEPYAAGLLTACQVLLLFSIFFSLLLLNKLNLKEHCSSIIFF